MTIHCDCTVCTKIRPGGLNARISTAHVTRLAGPSGRLGVQATHSLCWMANHPQLAQAAQIRRFGPWAA